MIYVHNHTSITWLSHDTRSSKDETDGIVKIELTKDVVTETQAVENSLQCTSLEQVEEDHVLHSSHSYENESETVLETSLDNPQTETHTTSRNNTHITDQTKPQDTLIENGQLESSPSSVSSSPPHSPAHSQRRRSSHLSLEGKKFMKDLNIEEGKNFQKKYEGYWAYLVAILLFYAIPSYQLFLTYQKVCMTKL